MTSPTVRSAHTLESVETRQVRIERCLEPAQPVDLGPGLGPHRWTCARSPLGPRILHGTWALDAATVTSDLRFKPLSFGAESEFSIVIYVYTNIYIMNHNDVYRELYRYRCIL